VGKPETRLNYKVDSAIQDDVESAFVHSCDGLAKAARFSFSVLRKVFSEDQLKDM